MESAVGEEISKWANLKSYILETSCYPNMFHMKTKNYINHKSIPWDLHHMGKLWFFVNLLNTMEPKTALNLQLSNRLSKRPTFNVLHRFFSY